MLFACFTLDFYQAFRYNALLFLLLPLGLGLYIESIFALRAQRPPIYQKIPNSFWVSLIIIAIIYAILRNLPWFSFLAPTTV